MAAFIATSSITLTTTPSATAAMLYLYRDLAFTSTMSTITIKNRTDTEQGWQFTVTITANLTTTHHVTLHQIDWQNLTQEKMTPDELITQSFRFLLERESNASILRSFNITAITRYWPDFPAAIQQQLKQS